MSNNIKQVWDGEIVASGSSLKLNVGEIARHWYLCMLFVRRDLVATYKQTVLGPLWFLLQPILTTITYTLIFGGLADLSTDGIPRVLFYLSGITVWTYFSETLVKTSNTLVANQQMFGKVYFPRMIVPLSVVITHLVKFGIQFLLFLAVLGYYVFFSGVEGVQPTWQVLWLPVMVLTMAMLGLGLGTIISAMTTKYRDLTNLVGFGVQLLMFASPIIYPLSEVSGKLGLIIRANPMTSIIHNFKVAFIGVGDFDYTGMAYSFVFGLVMLITGIIVFNRVERSFIDTV